MYFQFAAISLIKQCFLLPLDPAEFGPTIFCVGRLKFEVALGYLAHVRDIALGNLITIPLTLVAVKKMLILQPGCCGTNQR